MTKRRLAIFTHGGIGAGNFSQGVPVIMQIVEGLAEVFDVTVFSLSTFNKDFKPQNYRAYCVPASVRFATFRWFYLIMLFFRQAVKSKFNGLYSFWGYPMGLVVLVLGKITRTTSFINLLGAETANIPDIGYGHLRKPMSRALVLWTCRRANYLITVSNNQIEALKRNGIERGDIHLIPIGVDTTVFRPSVKNTQLPLKIVHVSNLNPVKDQVTLIRTFSLIREKIQAKLRIVGPDFLNGKIQRLVDELGLTGDVEFTGAVAYTKISEHFHWADMFLLTSLSEGQNSAITEAMTCGLLPASTTVGIMDKKFGSEVGIVAAPGDYQSLAEQIITLYLDKEQWHAKAARAAAWANSHNMQWTINELVKLIDNAA